MIMKTSMKFFMCFIGALLIMTATSCKKDSLEDAVLTPSVQGEIGASGTNGQNGSDGQDGAQGEQGASGADGKNGQDGADGAEGAQGATGAQGEPGANGTDGQDGAAGVQGEQGIQGERGETGPAGANGTDGTNGTDGQDGNANVRSFRYSLTSVASSRHSIEIPQLTTDVMENDVILTYLQFSRPLLLTYQLPAMINVGLGGGRTISAEVAVALWAGRITLLFREPGSVTSLRDSDIQAGDLRTLRVVIIKSTDSATGKNTKQNINQELKAAGVDIDNYDEVARYYGLN